MINCYSLELFKICMMFESKGHNIFDGVFNGCRYNTEDNYDIKWGG